MNFERVVAFFGEHSALEGAAALGGKELEPYYTLLEGGRNGEFYRVSAKFRHEVALGWNQDSRLTCNIILQLQQN